MGPNGPHCVPEAKCGSQPTSGAAKALKKLNKTKEEEEGEVEDLTQA